MVKKLSQYIPGIKLGAQLDVKVPGGVKIGQTVLVPLFETEQVIGLGAASTSQTIFVDDNASGTYVVAGVASRFGTASTSGTLQVEVAGAGVAVGSGVNQLTGTISLAGTANTTVNGTLIASPTVITAGSAVNIILGGTLTGYANGALNVLLQRVS